ncbi:MAG TPA: histidine phosphatase family protein [Ilumatobacteraceae bacterium]|nr:histidine phosphatase family protein [Ilumatobacteraceae bacterium]
MELLLVRHALPLRLECVDGPADPDLSPDGHAQAEHLATYLSSEHLDAIYASPLRRAYQTAQAIAANRSIIVQLCDGIAEFDRYSGEYIPPEDLKAENDPRYYAVIGGQWDNEYETADAFQHRVVSEIELLVDRHPGERIAVVCHGGVINSYFCHVLGLSRQRGFFYPNYTSINRVAAARGGTRSVITINETPHLRGTGLPIGVFQGAG